jgi:small-conductance mechanosensitive channel
MLLAAVFVFSGLVRVLPRTGLGRASLMVTNQSKLVISRSLGLLRLAAIVVWLYLLIRIFELGAPVSRWATRTVDASLTLGSLNVSVGDVLVFVVVIWLAALLSRLVRFVLREEVLPRMQLERGAAEAGATLAHWIILAVGIVAASAAAGISGAQLAVIGGALGLGIGFGLQSAMNNFISGLILVAERPIKVGDTIEVGTLLGEVTRIGFRASTVRTRDGAEVVVPNGSLTSERLVNWTLSDHTRRFEVPVGVEYGSDPERVIDLLLRVADSHEELLDSPAAVALFVGLGESSMDFALRCWISRFDDWQRVRSEVTVAIYRSLNEEGIGIAFPRRNVHMRSADSD